MRALLLALALLPALAHAQVRQGLFELGGTASLTSVDAETDRLVVFVLNPRVGYFLTRELEAGVDLRYLYQEGFGDSGDVGVFAAYHFVPTGRRRRPARTVPFVGASIGTSFTDDADVVAGAFGGAKFFFLPGGALTGQLALRTDGDGADFGVEAGVSIFF